MKRDVLGDVRSVRTEMATWDLTNESWQVPMRVTVEEYRLDGKRASSETRGEGWFGRSTNIYDDAGRLIESQIQDGTGKIGRQIYSYDAAGRQIRQVHQGPDGLETFTEENTYAADGSRTRMMYLPKMEGTVSCYTAIDDIDYYLGAEGLRTMITLFDSQGQATELLAKDEDGAILRRMVMTRDERGRLVKDELFLGSLALGPDIPMFGAGASFMTSEYSYDARGLRSEVIRRMSGLSEERQTYSYDQHGNKTESSTELQEREATVNEGNVEYGAPKVTRLRGRMSYRYDERGNWVERVSSQRYGENPDYTPGSIERREIVYFDAG